MTSVLAQSVKAADETSWWLATGLPILVTVLVAVGVTVVARIVVGRFRRKLEAAPSLSKAQGLQRAATLADALSATIVVVIWTVAILIVLGYLNVSLAPLIASAGIAGVALGFGAQSIVRDGLSGFFILLENQFGVGDTIELQTTANPVAGRVETFTLRSTALRAFDGTLHVVPNGNIQVVSNKSRGWARAIVDTRFAYGEDPERVRGLLDELFEELRQDLQLKEWLMDGPTVLGVETTGDYAVVIRAVAETRPSKKFDTERLLRERITQRLAERGVKAPTPPGVAPPSRESG
jgi:small conductance mechanosensitive channel